MPSGYANPSNPVTNPPDPGQPYNRAGYLNSDPDAAFWAWLQDSGNYNPSTLYGKYAQSQQGRIYNEFKSEAASDPNMGFYDWLSQGNAGDLQGQFDAQSPEQRGDYSSRMLTPRARWAVG